MPRFKRALLIANERARQVKDHLPRALEYLTAAGVETTIIACRRESLQQDLAAHRGTADLVIVAGGDGTVNGVIDALLPHGLPIALLPLGTANDLARTLAIPTDLQAACQLIAAGHTRTIDLGWVNGKHFFNVASLGLSVSITQQLSSTTKKHFGALAYGLTALKVLARFRPFHAELSFDGRTETIRSLQIAAGNGRYYGGGMQIAANAVIDDGRLNLYSIEVEKWWSILPLLRSLRTGQLVAQSKVRTLVAHEVRIHTRRPRRVNTDGEITTQTPAHIRVIPRAVEICVPAAPADSAKSPAEQSADSLN